MARAKLDFMVNDAQTTPDATQVSKRSSATNLPAIRIAPVAPAPEPDDARELEPLIPAEFEPNRTAYELFLEWVVGRVVGQGVA